MFLCYPILHLATADETLLTFSSRMEMYSKVIGKEFHLGNLWVYINFKRFNYQDQSKTKLLH